MNPENQKKLDELISRFVDNKHELDSYTKIVNKEKSEIKSLLANSNLSEWQVGQNRVYLTKRTTQIIDEDGLLEYLKSIHADRCIKTKEYIDSDELEKAIYHGVISDSQVVEMSKFYTDKETIAVNIGKVKA